MHMYKICFITLLIKSMTLWLYCSWHKNVDIWMC